MRKVAACVALAGSFEAIQAFPFQKKQKEVPTAPPPDPCKCLNWIEQYTYGTVKCGNGAELFTYTNGANTHDALTSLMREGDTSLCKTANASLPYFPQQNHNYCIRVTGQAVKGRDAGSWCYVNLDCMDKGASQVFQAQVKSRSCGSDDYKLGDLQPSDVFTLAKQQRVSYKTAAKMAYRFAMKPWGGDYDKLEDMLDDRYETVDTPLVFNAPSDELRVVYQGQRWIVYKDENAFPFCLSGCWYTPPSAQKVPLPQPVDLNKVRENIYKAAHPAKAAPVGLHSWFGMR